MYFALRLLPGVTDDIKNLSLDTGKTELLPIAGMDTMEGTDILPRDFPPGFRRSQRERRSQERNGKPEESKGQRINEQSRAGAYGWARDHRGSLVTFLERLPPTDEGPALPAGRGARRRTRSGSLRILNCIALERH